MGGRSDLELGAPPLGGARDLEVFSADIYHETVRWEEGFMSNAAPEYRGFAKVFWNGRSQAVRLPAACRFETSEVEIVKMGEIVTLRPRGKNWTSYFEAASRGSLPARRQPPLDDRGGIR